MNLKNMLSERTDTQPYVVYDSIYMTETKTSGTEKMISCCQGLERALEGD